jgi:hypothetical protein
MDEKLKKADDVQQQSFASFLFALFCYHKRQMR